MPISVQCTQCGKTLRVPDAAAGKRGKCPCGTILNVPAAGSIQPGQSAPPRPPVGGRGAAVATRPSAQPGTAYAGSVTPPATFQMLFKLYLILFGVIFGLGLLLGIFLFLGVNSAASDPRSTFMVVDTSLDNKGPMKMPDMNEFKPPSGSHSASLFGFGGIYFVLCLACGGLALVATIVQTVVILIFLYKAWDLIQDGQARTSPGKAIGFLFIPFFNLYWMFVALWGLCVDLNRYAQNRGINARAASANLMLAALIMELCSIIPLIGPILGLVSVILGLIALNSVKNGCVDIATAKA